jgi:hypothetical protein
VEPVNQPAPKLKSVELYNRLLDLVVEDDADEVVRIMWRLKSLVRQNPTNFASGVALIEASLMCGERQSAVAEIEKLWKIRHIEESQALRTYVYQLIDVGNYGRCKHLVEEFMCEKESRIVAIFEGLLVNCAFYFGDVGWIETMRGDAFGARINAQASGMIQNLKKSGLSNHLGNHQEIVRSAVKGKQTSIFLRDRQGSESTLCLTNLISVPATRLERRVMESNIDDALQEYYASVDLPPTFYLDRLNTIIVSGYLQTRSIE